MKKIWIFFCLVSLSLGASRTSYADHFAVLFSGGFNPRENFDHYYDETLRMWNIVTGTLNYDVGNVYVLFADGTDPAGDRTSGSNSDWSMITAAGGHIRSAYYDDLSIVLSGLGGIMDSNDSFLFWSFDHGGGSGSLPPPSDKTVLWGWGEEAISDNEFASWVNPWSLSSEAYVFGQCYAGGFVDDLAITSDDGRFAAWAADWYELSWGQGYVDAWADGIESGLRYTHDLAEYAMAIDPYARALQEHPGYTGDNFDLVSVQTVPEPSTMVLLGCGLFGIAGLRKRLGLERSAHGSFQ